ncbi:hypothetical protein BD410DRAFT_843064 [Rickenella mellea]|uniref:BTB domain-containing protein n=1 Tax=Rickenella mellea TaxID=50990 RepID=A0A4Y7PTP2_9AGAM|nr:hypothetical protein BD410DRAFT_843064 [Rickenella mellea]
MAHTNGIRVRLPSAIKTAEKLSDSECAPPVYISYEKDDDYYFSWLVFLVGQRLFNVPRHYFEQSTVFVDMFKLPSGKKIEEGTSIQHPIELKNVSVEDFKAFLKLLIPRPGHEKDELTRAEWLGVLSLSNMWDFREFRELAITKLAPEKMQATERILLGYKYEIWDWLVYSHAHLVARKRFLSVEEARKLGGLPFAINMGLAREKARQQYSGWKLNVENCRFIVSDIFDLPSAIGKNTIGIEDD